MSDQSLEEIAPAQIESNYDETIASFDDMALKKELVRGIYNYGFERPSAVQQRAIAPVIKGRDVVLEAPFTTGKTHALCIAALQALDAEIKTCQSLILTSSFREAQKIAEFTSEISQFIQIDSPAAVGRRDAEEDHSALRDGQQFVVGTPARVLELIQLQAINVDSARLLVLDGADELVSRDFSEHILAIHQHLPGAVRTVILSATMPQEVLDITTKFLRTPLHIVVSKCARPLHRVKQVFMAVQQEDQKLEILSHLGDLFGVAQTVVFCNTRKILERLAEECAYRDITVSAMHADMTAIERAGLLQEFRSGAISTLLATNMLAARGIEAHAASLMVNYDLPIKHEDYFHRTSSGGRFSRECLTINLATAAEVYKIREIESFYNTEIKEMPNPLLLRSGLSTP